MKESMKKLLLFDIDRTLVTSAHDNGFVKAIGNLHGLDMQLDSDIQGHTDYLILGALLRREGWSERQIMDAMPRLIQELDSVHAETFNPASITILPGVRELLDALEKTGIMLGLITGNLESIAERKLSAVGIWQYFTVGGYGSDPHTTRADLVRVAILRAGYDNQLENVYVIGDTARDIQAAHDAGITNSVGVANGFRDIQELIDAHASVVLENFKDTQLVLDTLRIVDTYDS